MPWRGPSGNAPGARRMKSPPDASTTRPATAPPTKAENARPGYEHKTRVTSSAVMLGPRRAISAHPVGPTFRFELDQPEGRSHRLHLFTSVVPVRFRRNPTRHNSATNARQNPVR